VRADVIGTDSVEVEGSFPAQFTLPIYQPPEPALLNDWGDAVKFGDDGPEHKVT
jgi:hypothetical protein